MLTVYYISGRHTVTAGEETAKICHIEEALYGKVRIIDGELANLNRAWQHGEFGWMTKGEGFSIHSGTLIPDGRVNYGDVYGTLNAHLSSLCPYNIRCVYWELYNPIAGDVIPYGMVVEVD